MHGHTNINTTLLLADKASLNKRNKTKQKHVLTTAIYKPALSRHVKCLYYRVVTPCGLLDGYKRFGENYASIFMV